MASRAPRLVGDESSESTIVQSMPDAATILDNVVQLDEMLDEGSRAKLAELPYLELSKHLKIKRS